MAWRNWLKASAIATAAGSVALMIAQSIFQDWWDSSENEARAELNRQQTEYLSRSVEAIDRSTDAVANLNRKLEEIARRAEEAERRQTAGYSQVPAITEQGASTVQTATDVTADPIIPGTTPEASTPPADANAKEEMRESAPAEQEAPRASSPETAARRPANGDIGVARVFGVFEAQAFDLCGHKGFAVELLVNGAGSEVLLKSRNRDIPGAGFRGFEKKLQLKAPVELWAGCTVAIGTVETSGTAKRMIISVAEGKKA